MMLLRLCFLLIIPCWGMSQQGNHAARAALPGEKELAALPPDGGEKWNRLVFESSPYLLQHAANPVDWYPWGDAAFQRARTEDKPIFLSIGYATCHWCHVMESESFEDPEVAALLNRDFICIKVDREERPDIDQIYMSACQMLNGSGGWPLNAVLTHDLRPFFVGTYFPKHGSANQPGLMELLPQILRYWKEKRAQVMEGASSISQRLLAQSSTSDSGKMDPKVLDQAFQHLALNFDSQRGGFGSSPKFPSPHHLLFLLRYGQSHKSARASEMACFSLRKMRQGGIYDQVGFGFHRYATDANWLVPHFEKMLYDQALLALAYLEAFQATGETEFADAAREIFSYVLRDMTDPHGGFYSAEDADSEGREGKFYLWSLEEVEAILGPKQAQLWASVYQLKSEGNFQEPGGSGSGQNIPFLKQSMAQTAQSLVIPEDVLRNRLEAARLSLFKAREKRVHALKDDKILTDWNGLMIAALARGARVLGEKKYELAASKAAAFIESHLRMADGRLLKRYRLGKAGLPAHLDDYAFLAWGLLELYQTSFETKHLARAVELMSVARNDFWDPNTGGFFLSAKDEALIMRSKTVHDGALPSGNSVAALNLLKLSRLGADRLFGDSANQIFQVFAKQLSQEPTSATFLLCGFSAQIEPSYEVVIVGKRGASDTQAMLQALNKVYLPGLTVLFKPVGEEDTLSQVVPFLAEYRCLDQKATAYVCQNFTCQLPTNQVKDLLSQLGVASN